MDTHMYAHLSRRRCGDLGQYYGPRGIVCAALARFSSKARLPFQMVLWDADSSGKMSNRRVVWVHPGWHSWVT